METNYTTPNTTFSTDKGLKVVDIYVDLENHVLYLEWSWKYDYGFDIIKEAAMKAVDLIKEHQLKGAIANLQKMQGNWDPINDWIVSIWLPAVQEAGATHWVHIHPEEFFAGLSTEVLEEGFMLGGLQAKNVKTLDAALHWWKLQFN